MIILDSFDVTQAASAPCGHGSGSTRPPPRPVDQPSDEPVSQPDHGSPRIVALATAADIASGLDGAMGSILMIALAHGVEALSVYRDDESAFDGPIRGSGMRKVISDAGTRGFEAVIVSGLASLGDDLVDALGNLLALRLREVAVLVTDRGEISPVDLIGMPLWQGKSSRAEGQGPTDRSATC